MSGKQMFAGPSQTIGQKEDFDQTSLARFLLSNIPSSYYNVIYDDSALPTAGLLY